MEVELHKRRNRKSKSESKNRSRVWKSGERFQGIDSDSGEYISGKIMYRAGKATAANRDFYNIERDDNGWQGCLFVCLFVVYLEYIQNYIVTHTVICNQIFTQGFIPKQSLGTDFHWGPQIIYPRLRGQCGVASQ